MNVNEIAVGQRAMWYLLEKLGEGDAGEVYRVESTLEGKQAILKRPRKSAYSSDALRQAAQIRTEGNILQALQGIPFPDQGTRLATPSWLDQSRTEDGIGDRFFIVLERARGLDLKALRQIARFGLIEGMVSSPDEEYKFFIETLAQLGEIPEPIVVRAFLGALQLMEMIHSTPVLNDITVQSGVLWNDVKPEHLYWDPAKTCLTVIDWGNSQFLEPNKATKDQRYTINDDYTQFIQEMGAFLAESNPALHTRLGWPQGVTPFNVYNEGIIPLKERLNRLQEKQLAQLKKLRRAETRLNGETRPQPDHIAQSEDLQRRFVAFGESPDIPAAIQLHARLALQMASENNLEAFAKICEKTARLAAPDSEKWGLLGKIAVIAMQQDPGRLSFSQALSAAVADDWPSALWELAELVGEASLPAWWEPISQGVRQVFLKLDQDTLPPSVEVSRVFYTLQAAILKLGDQNLHSDSSGGDISTEQIRSYESLLNVLNEEVVKKWKEIDPPPPNSGIGYDEFDGLTKDMDAICPGTQEKLEKILAQPRAQAGIVLDAWERKEFDTARRAVHMLLLWDPERRRLLRADRALGMASAWLSRLFQGAASEEPFYDYITALELEGRRLRSQVGPAKWLDVILDALKRLRKGSKHADLIMEHPEILTEIPWLNEHRSREILSLPRTRPLRLERDAAIPGLAGVVSGVVETRLGANQDVHLVEPLDTWMPEARGSSARVLAGYLRNRADQPSLYAIKIMRPDRIDYALPLFREEAQILTLLRDVPGITPLVECGFLRLKNAQDFPSDEGHTAIKHLRGEVVRFGVEETQNFLASMERYLAQEWLPYLALVKRDQDQNLMKYCDAGYNHGWFLPLRESLLLTIQICDILQNAHDRNIVYRDHKILHYYWHPASHGVVMIDWNIAKREPQGLSEAERQFELAQFGARALHHILTGRPAAGALPQGPNRPEDIEHSALSYPVNWTFDDERLPNRVKEIIEGVLNQKYTYLKDLRQDLAQVYQQIPDPVLAHG